MAKALDFVGVPDAAFMLGVSRARVRQLLASRRVRGRKVNERSWVVSVKSLRRYATSQKRNLFKLDP